MTTNANSKLVEAWKKYYLGIDAARQAMEATPRFRDNPDHRAQMYYSLAEAQAMAYNFAIAPKVDQPWFHTHSWFSYFYTLGGTCPDFYYGTLFLDGKRSYRITGRFGDLKLILMQVFSHLLGHPESKMLMNADFSTFKKNADGSFEAIISATRQEGNWIPLDPQSDYNFIFVRRAIADWHGDRGELKISLIDGPIDYDELDQEKMASRLETAAHFLKFLVDKWNIGIYDMYLEKNSGKKNVVVVAPGDSIASDYAGSPTTNYVWGVYEIADDEALIIESDVPEAGYWSMQLFDVFCKPFDFVNRQSDVNMSRAVIDGDGRYRCVIALKDPGVANWLDPSGRKEGTIVGRTYHAKSMLRTPEIKVVKAADLRKHLPADTTYLTPAERQRALAYRRDGYMKLYGD